MIDGAPTVASPRMELRGGPSGVRFVVADPVDAPVDDAPRTSERERGQPLHSLQQAQHPVQVQHGHPAPAEVGLDVADTHHKVTVAGHGRIASLLKVAFDRAIAFVALLVLLPALAMIALAVRLGSRGPALFWQTRIGRNGNPFTMIKFRSMYSGAEARVTELLDRNESAGGVLFKIRDDPRVTPIGRILRRTSLDELPQLINVLMGSMSLVGPRPALPSEVSQYGPRVRQRLLVKPGLTGLWQVSGRSDLSWDDSVRLDLRYVEEWSLRLDIVVLLKTVRAVFRSEGAY